MNINATKPLVSVIFVTYKRHHLLKRTLDSLLENTDYPRSRLELIVCDDGSDSETQAEIRKMPFDRYCLSLKNQGMGANTNRGLRLAEGDFILQLQDDWLCLGPSYWLDVAICCLREREDVGLIRLRTPCNTGGVNITLSDGRTCSIYGPAHYESNQEYGYTDNPHVKTRAFVRDVGYYREDLSMPETEIEYCRRVDQQTKWKVGWLEGMSIFEHIGADETFNPCNIRARRLAYLSKIPGADKMLAVARRTKATLISRFNNSTR